MSPDGQHAVYVADQDTPGTLELYSVPVDGSSAALRLNAPLVPGGNVDPLWFALSPDSAHVVYLADQNVNDVFTLHGAPIDGSASALELVSLSGALDVRDFRITPDSTRVVYRADQLVDESIELFRVALDGSSPPARLNAPLLGIDDVGDIYHVTPDSARVLYLADQAADANSELYSVRLDLSSAPVKLSTPEGGAQLPALSPDGRWAAYVRNRPTLGSRQLVLTSVDGSRAPEVLTQLASGRTLGAFSFTPDSRRLLYLADQETAGVNELFQCLVGRPLRRR